MKSCSLSILLLTLALLFPGCDSKEKEKSADIYWPEDKISLKSMGLAYLEHNQLDYAEAAFEKLITIDPEDPLGYANLGLVYLRMGKYPQAEAQTQKALEIDPHNADIRLILANIYEHNLQPEQAITELEKIIEQTPDYAKAYYSLAQLYAKNSVDDAALEKQEAQLTTLVEIVPANAVARIQLIEVLAKNQKTDECLKHLDELQEIIPVFPSDSEEHYHKAKQLLNSHNPAEALKPIRLFHNSMKLTTAYLSGNQQIKGPGGEYIGFPVITTSQSVAPLISEGQSVIDIMRFAEASSVTDLQPEDQPVSAAFATLALTDYDGDRDVDVYFSYLKAGANASDYFLYTNDLGSFTDSKNATGIEHRGIEKFITSTDYNNDGFIDLFIITENAALLYKNNGDATYSDVTGKAGLNGAVSRFL